MGTTRGIAALLLVCLLVVGVIWFFGTSVNNLSQEQLLEDKRQLEEAITRSCVACYAAEGIYPPDLEYLEEHYGIQVDRDRYTVMYDVFATNLMPDVTVLENE